MELSKRFRIDKIKGETMNNEISMLETVLEKEQKEELNFSKETFLEEFDRLKRYRISQCDYNKHEYNASPEVKELLGEHYAIRQLRIKYNL